MKLLDHHLHVSRTFHRCQVNGKMVWLCDKHKKVSRSKTEEQYDDQTNNQNANIPIPMGGNYMLYN